MTVEQIPLDDNTRPDQDVVDLARRRIERNRREQNERDARRVPLQRRRDDDGPSAA